MFTAQTPAISFNLNMANFDRDQLPVQMTDTLKMAQFAIIECSQMDAKAYVHEKANPYLARMLSNGIKRELINLRPGQEGQADADAVTDTHGPANSDQMHRETREHGERTNGGDP